MRCFFAGLSSLLAAGRFSDVLETVGTDDSVGGTLSSDGVSIWIFAGVVEEACATGASDAGRGRECAAEVAAAVVGGLDAAAVGLSFWIRAALVSLEYPESPFSLQRALSCGTVNWEIS